MGRDFDLRNDGKPCFLCDGTGQMCNVCGESQKACSCPEDEPFDGFDCTSCNGTGNAGKPKPTRKPRRSQ